VRGPPFDPRDQPHRRGSSGELVVIAFIPGSSTVSAVAVESLRNESPQDAGRLHVEGVEARRDDPTCDGEVRRVPSRADPVLRIWACRARSLMVGPRGSAHEHEKERSAPKSASGRRRVEVVLSPRECPWGHDGDKGMPTEPPLEREKRDARDSE